MKKITYNDINEIRPYLDKYGYNEYNCNIVTLLMWKDVYELFYEIHDHFFVSYWLYHDHIRWMMPLCDDRYLAEAIHYMIDYSNKHHFEFVIEAAIEPFIAKIKQISEYQFIHRLELNAGDYIYDAKMHQTLSGKKMQKRRNHYNAFIKEYEKRYRYCPYEKNQYDDVMSFLTRWQENHEYKEDINAEINGIRQMLQHYDELGLMAGCIYIDNQLEAFTIGSPLKEDTLQIHVEKANKNIRGLYVAILKHFLMEHSQFTYINREDDLGIPSLRKAKMDLHPIKKLNKYAIGLDTSTIIKATDIHKEQIKDLWLECFQDENEKSTDFYFEHLYDSKNTYILECQGMVLSALQAKPLQIKWGNQEISTHFIVGVSTKPVFRHNGFMKRLLNFVLEDLKDDPLIILQAYYWELYQPFGFDTYYMQQVISLEDENDETENHISIVEKIDSQLLLDCYKEYTKNLDGYRIRNKEYYDHYFIPYHNNEGNVIVVLKKEEQILGYIVYHEFENNISILESTINNYKAIAQYFKISGLKQKVDLYTDLYNFSNNDNLCIKNMAIKFNNSSLKDFFTEDRFFINEIL